MSNESSSITLSSNAVKRIQTLLPNQESNYFRVYVTGGGCSGFQYGFKFEGDPAGDDDVINFKDFTILLDSLSYPYLYGSTLDYV
ncbi:MAG: iron-sulfur cluster assembly accessory protein, partial [SAR86 cluster bacterium]|nr:iron-sulfur cluster assembly accessory protein [SAR86 cluster bacterium]